MLNETFQGEQIYALFLAMPQSTTQKLDVGDKAASSR